ncbi:MAG: sodium:calcium antiporter [Pseudomonadota bacterium]
MGQSTLFLAIVLPVCLAVVVLSAGYFVRGAVAVATRLSVPEFIVGSVIVAVGTSAPEVAINISAALGEAGDIVVSNIVGSNIVNVALGVGIAGCMITFGPLGTAYQRTLLLGLFGTVFLVIYTLVTSAAGVSQFSRLVGALLLASFLIFMWHSIRNPGEDDDEDDLPADMALPLAIVCIVGGAAAMAVCSDLAVRSAVTLASRVGIPEAVIGATIIAAGGSLPEVSSCIAAARIKRPNLILGNIAGSQIFNVLGILGLSGIITSFSFSTQLAADMGILVALTLIMLACLWNARFRPAMGPLLVACYGFYAVYLVTISA